MLNTETNVSIPVIQIFLCVCVVVLEFELSTSHLLGKHFPTWVISPAFLVFFTIVYFLARVLLLLRASSVTPLAPTLLPA
jgi:hypothetical protein